MSNFQKNIVTSESGGLHIFEVHMPTVKTSSFIALGMILAFFLIYKAILLIGKECWRKAQRVQNTIQTPARAAQSFALEGRFPEDRV